MRKRHGHWTRERLQREADRYPSRRQFQSRCPSAYAIAHRQHLVDELFRNHPNQGYSAHQVRNRTWSDKAECLSAARKCRTRSEFHRGYRGAYASCKLNGWFDEATAHMERVGNDFRRSVYTIIDQARRIVYVGISKNPKERFKDHLREGRDDVRRLIKSGAILKTVHLLVEKTEAARLEGEVIRRFRNKKWTVLNRAPAGGLGGNYIIWTHEACRKVAASCSSRAEFKERFDGACQAATRNGWMDEFFARRPNRGYTIEPHGSYTDKRLSMLARACSTRGEFAKSHPSPYQTALQRGLIDILFRKHPNEGFANRRRGSWTINACLEAAAQCATRKQFHERFAGAHAAAYTNGWLERIFANHPNAGLLQRPRGSLTKTAVAKLAGDCESLKVFRERHPSVYAIALKRQWTAALFGSAPSKFRQRAASGHWTVAVSKSAAKRFHSRAEIKREAWGAYETLRKANLLDRYFPKRAAAKRFPT